MPNTLVESVADDIALQEKDRAAAQLLERQQQAAGRICGPIVGILYVVERWKVARDAVLLKADDDPDLASVQIAGQSVDLVLQDRPPVRELEQRLGPVVPNAQANAGSENNNLEIPRVFFHVSVFVSGWPGSYHLGV